MICQFYYLAILQNANFMIWRNKKARLLQNVECRGKKKKEVFWFAEWTNLMVPPKEKVTKSEVIPFGRNTFLRHQASEKYQVVLLGRLQKLLTTTNLLNLTYLDD